MSPFLEKYSLKAFAERVFVETLVDKLVELSPATARSARRCLLQRQPELHPKVAVKLEPRSTETVRMDVNLRGAVRAEEQNVSAAGRFFLLLTHMREGRWLDCRKLRRVGITPTPAR
ncbi:retrotransposon hot spot (RHS) protein [Trypanosoma rangeli]|uniref:Retrotransposon hot spot (RHS) protein n=1 Tax=Trypanosoma rangeli TaxID=5698 RepID=A0A422N149_TRYRA|nr:retrotransposon hot spot (RHS) protein [Trypanosoma rangeli]RNE99180.1 retrotransposon hot spot (RHS) protein [Trypanosoma rangeli]|eukprot:RNE99180.1 retrotransposon hot spot (RHS) protein [Trypanosoma rangeli]